MAPEGISLVELFNKKGPENGTERHSSLEMWGLADSLAERGGFEPPIELLTL